MLTNFTNLGIYAIVLISIFQNKFTFSFPQFACCLLYLWKRCLVHLIVLFCPLEERTINTRQSYKHTLLFLRGNLVQWNLDHSFISLQIKQIIEIKFKWWTLSLDNLSEKHRRESTSKTAYIYFLFNGLRYKY